MDVVSFLNRRLYFIRQLYTTSSAPLVGSVIRCSATPAFGCERLDMRAQH
jgi:hypothetical protein